MTPTSLNPERSGSDQPSRRKFLATASAVALGAAGAIMGLFNVIFLRPRVTYGSPSKIRVGRPQTYAPGSLIEMPAASVVVRRNGNRFSAVSTVCTHLGCTVKATEIGFDCPCHGSTYDQDGNVISGPAPRALSWYRVAMAPNGELEVDKRQVVPSNTYLEVKA